MGATVKWNDQKRAWYLYTNHNKKRKAQAFGDDKQAALDARREVLTAIKLGHFAIRSVGQSPTLATCAQTFLTTPRANVKRSTVTNIEKNLRVHVLPVLGHKLITDLTKDDVLLLIQTCREQESATNTILNNILPALSGVLSFAVDKKLIPANPCNGMREYATNADEIKKEVVPLTRDQAASVLEALAEAGRYDYWVFFLLLLRTGLRLGEAIALYWDAIDLKARTIRVKQNMSGDLLSSPKKKQNRTVGISQQLAEALMTHKVHEEMKAKRAGRKTLYDFVFNNEGAWWRPQILRHDVFYPARRRAGLSPRVTPHWLRHTFVSQLLHDGVPIATVSRIIGHNSINITVNTYGHLMPDQDKSMVDALDDPRVQPPRNLQPVEIVETL